MRAGRNLLQRGQGYAERRNALAEASAAEESNRIRAWAYKQLTGRDMAPASANALAGALDFVPGVGDASGFEDAYQDFKGGNLLSGAVNAAGATVGVVPGVGDAAGAALGIFAGALAKNADKVKLARAQQLADNGADARAVWDETGWFQGADGKWRFEIDDSKAYADVEDAAAEMGTERIASGVPLDHVFNHEELFAAYPDTGNINTFLKPKRGGMFASYSTSGDEISLYGPQVDEKAKSSVLHELQHGVQSREGFASGANDASAYMSNELRPLWQKRVEELLSPRSREEYYAQLKPSWPDATPEDLAKSYNDYVKSARAAMRDPYSPANKAAQETAAMEIYRGHVGEVEARNVQSRLSMTPEQRRATPPWETEDTPRDRQIVRFR